MTVNITKPAGIEDGPFVHVVLAQTTHQGLAALSHKKT
jgi:hypothetical protein